MRCERPQLALAGVTPEEFSDNYQRFASFIMYREEVGAISFEADLYEHALLPHILWRPGDDPRSEAYLFGDKKSQTTFLDGVRNNLIRNNKDLRKRARFRSRVEFSKSGCVAVMENVCFEGKRIVLYNLFDEDEHDNYFHDYKKPRFLSCSEFGTIAHDFVDLRHNINFHPEGPFGNNTALEEVVVSA